MGNPSLGVFFGSSFFSFFIILSSFFSFFFFYDLINLSLQLQDSITIYVIFFIKKITIYIIMYISKYMAANLWENYCVLLEYHKCVLPPLT